MAALFAGLAAPAGAAPPATSARVRTVAGSHELPAATVTATWEETPRGERLRVDGTNPPGVVTTVTATWTGVRRADAHGRLLRLRHDHTYDVTGSDAAARTVVEYRLGRRWYRPADVRAQYRASVGLTRYSSAEEVLVRASAAAGRVVTVRVTVELRYSAPATDVDDSVLVFGKV